MALVMSRTPGLISPSKLELSWKEKDLGRKISVDFVRNRTEQLYGVTRVNAVYETRRYWEPNDQKMVTEFVSMTTFLMEPWEFRIPIGNSYLCKDAGSKTFHTVLRKSNDPKGDSGILLPDAVLVIQKVHLDAFRPITATSGKFQPPTDCDLPRQASIILKIVTYIKDVNYGDHTYTVRTKATFIIVTDS